MCCDAPSNFADPQGLANLEPRVHDDNRSGLAQMRFQLLRIDPLAGGNATRFLVRPSLAYPFSPFLPSRPTPSSGATTESLGNKPKQPAGG